MHIECPSCKADNKIEFGENILCSKCKKSFAGHYYKKFKKPLISATTALIIGAYGAVKIDGHFFEENRYPAVIEYALIDQCISSYDAPISYGTLSNKRDTCISALEKTQEVFSYSEFKEDQRKFMVSFRQKALYGK
jgi:hypothetical protein